MKYIKQLAIILFISLSGEVLSRILPLRLPGNIIAMILLFVLLMAKIIKEEHILETSDYLLSIIGLFLVPPTVAIIEYTDMLATVGIQLLIVSLTTFVLAFTGCAYTIRLTMTISKRIKGWDKNVHK